MGLPGGITRQESRSGLPFPPAGDLPDPGIKPASLKHLLHWQADSLPQAPPGKIWWITLPPWNN